MLFSKVQEFALLHHLLLKKSAEKHFRHQEDSDLIEEILMDHIEVIVEKTLQYRSVIAMFHNNMRFLLLTIDGPRHF